MAYRITGRVLVVGNTEEVPTRNGSTITKRDLVINVIKFDPNTGLPTADEQNTPKFTFIGEKVKSLDTLRHGDVVRIDFDITGRSYEKDGKTQYITEARPFRFDIASGKSNIIQNEALLSQMTEPGPVSNEEKNDDLPF